jgi:hypothetical protein
MKIIQLLTAIVLLTISAHAQSFFPPTATNIVVLNDSVNISWRANPEPNVIGYKLRVTNPAGTFNYEATNRLSTNVLLKTVTGVLTPGTHSLSLTAVNSAGLESSPAALSTNIVAVPSTPKLFKIEGVISLTPIP